MAPRTSQLLGLSATEVPAAIFTALGEGGPGRDPLGVLSTLLTRRQTGAYGKNLVDIAKAPSQFVANDRYTAAQISNPSFGRKVYGKRYDQLLQQFEDPQILAPVLQQQGGAVQFRGQGLLANRRSGDVMLDPKGNYYFDRRPEAQKTLLQKLQAGQVAESPAPAQAPQFGAQLPRTGVLETLTSALGFSPSQEEDSRTIAQRLADDTKEEMMQQLFQTNQFLFNLNPTGLNFPISFLGES